MKISASIYSDKHRSLETTLQDLVDHRVDLLHVDCNDDPAVFQDIAQIRNHCDIPIDLHIITEHPSKYYDLLVEHPVEYLTFQYENLKEPLTVPPQFKGKKGLAVTTPTPVQVFEAHTDFDFILIMATIPGQSGGVFDKENFNKIRQFRNRFPDKSIHVDGGVNAEVSFILRNMGVTSAVSGSFLFKASSVGNALMDLTKRDIESTFQIGDFMVPIKESPTLRERDLSLQNVLQSIEKGKLGFTLVTGENGQLVGLISNADVRRGLLRHIQDLDQVQAKSFVNRNPTKIQVDDTVLHMLKTAKQSPFPISYLPVVDAQGKACGIVTFVNLIKGEL